MTVRSIRTRLAVGTLGIRPKAVRLSTDADVALLEITEDDYSRLVSCGTELSEVPGPLAGAQDEASSLAVGRTKVFATGFEDSAVASSLTATVSDRSSGSIVLSGTVPEGFSGTPCFTDQGVLGVITRGGRTEGRAAVLPANEVQALIKSGQWLTMKIEHDNGLLWRAD